MIYCLLIRFYFLPDKARSVSNKSKRARPQKVVFPTLYRSIFARVLCNASKHDACRNVKCSLCNSEHNSSVIYQTFRWMSYENTFIVDSEWTSVTQIRINKYNEKSEELWIECLCFILTFLLMSTNNRSWSSEISHFFPWIGLISVFWAQLILEAAKQMKKSRWPKWVTQWVKKLSYRRRISQQNVLVCPGTHCGTAFDCWESSLSQSQIFLRIFVCNFWRNILWIEFEHLRFKDHAINRWITAAIY